MRSNASIADDTTKKTSRSGGAVPFPKPNRAMLFDSAGLACYIAWSFVFWNGSVLFCDLRHEAPVGEAQIVQAALTALAALVLVLLARRTAPLRRRTVLLAVFAAVSSLAIVVAALAGFGRAPMGWMLIAFALSGLGSTLRLGWEERMSVQGVERTAVCAGTAYLLGFLLFALISPLPYGHPAVLHLGLVSLVHRISKAQDRSQLGYKDGNSPHVQISCIFLADMGLKLDHVIVEVADIIADYICDDLPLQMAEAYNFRGHNQVITAFVGIADADKFAATVQGYSDLEQQPFSGSHAVEFPGGIKNGQGILLQRLIMARMAFVALSHISGCRQDIILEIVVKADETGRAGVLRRNPVAEPYAGDPELTGPCSLHHTAVHGGSRQ